MRTAAKSLRRGQSRPQLRCGVDDRQPSKPWRNGWAIAGRGCTGAQTTSALSRSFMGGGPRRGLAMGRPGDLTRQIPAKQLGEIEIVLSMTGRLLIELPEEAYLQLASAAQNERRTLKAEAAVLLEAALRDRNEGSRVLEFVGAGRCAATSTHLPARKQRARCMSATWFATARSARNQATIGVRYQPVTIPLTNSTHCCTAAMVSGSYCGAEVSKVGSGCLLLEAEDYSVEARVFRDAAHQRALTPNLRRAPIEAIRSSSLGPCHVATSRASALTFVTVSPKVIANCRAASDGIGHKSAGVGWNNCTFPSGGTGWNNCTFPAEGTGSSAELTHAEAQTGCPPQSDGRQTGISSPAAYPSGRRPGR